MTGHLIHIGFSKTGTHYLRRWFAAHPQLDYVEGGFAGFRQVYDIARLAVTPSEARYRVTSSESLSTPHPSAGLGMIDYDGVTANALAPARSEVCRTLASLFPQAHVLLVTRGFRSIIRSTYAQMVRTGFELDLTGYQALVRGQARSGDDYWDYDSLVDAYRSAFGDRLIVLPWELLRDDPSAFLATLEDRLGLDRHPPPADRPNRSLSQEELLWYPSFSRLVRRLAGTGAAGARLRRFYLRLIGAGRLRPLAAGLQRLRPRSGVSEADVDAAIVESYRGKATRLADDDLFRPYASDYLF